MMKKFISVSLGLGMILAAGSPAFAANTCGNFTTGPGSTNVCTRVFAKLASLGLTNNGTVNHTANFTANSGGNAANGNTIGASIGAGSASSVVASSASLNTGGVGVVQVDPATEEQGQNNVTGPGSNNQISFTTTKNVSVSVGNSGTIHHVVNASATSGGNSASGNTGGGAITTGEASVAGSVDSLLNSFSVSVSQ